MQPWHVTKWKDDCLPAGKHHPARDVCTCKSRSELLPVKVHTVANWTGMTSAVGIDKCLASFPCRDPNDNCPHHSSGATGKCAHRNNRMPVKSRSDSRSVSGKIAAGDRTEGSATVSGTARTSPPAPGAMIAWSDRTSSPALATVHRPHRHGEARWRRRSRHAGKPPPSARAVTPGGVAQQRGGFVGPVVQQCELTDAGEFVLVGTVGLGELTRQEQPATPAGGRGARPWTR